MNHHQVAPSTHTPELQQVTELNAELTGGRAIRITAADLGLDGAQGHGVALPAEVSGHQGPAGAVAGDPPHPGAASITLPGSAVLLRVVADGPPDYPYLYGLFRGSAADGASGISVSLHTAALRELSHRLGLRHRWGF